MYGTYCRLNVPVHAGWRTVVRAAAGKLRPEALRDPTLKDERNQFYREMLRYHADAQDMVHVWRL